MHSLPIAVHCAYRGYAWSNIPEGLTERAMDSLRALAAEIRGEFPDAHKVDRGVVAIGPVAAAFSIRTAPAWDSAGRDSEYAAFAFFKSIDASSLDFGKLLALPFFDAVTREVPRSVTCEGGPAESAPLPVAGALVCKRRYANLPAAQGGDLLARYFSKNEHWIFRLSGSGTLDVECGEWKRAL